MHNLIIVVQIAWDTAASHSLPLLCGKRERMMGGCIRRLKFRWSRNVYYKHFIAVNTLLKAFNGVKTPQFSHPRLLPKCQLLQSRLPLNTCKFRSQLELSAFDGPRKDLKMMKNIARRNSVATMRFSTRRYKWNFIF